MNEGLSYSFHLGSDKKQNMMLRSDAGYVFGTDIKGQTIGGQFVRTTSLLDSEQYRSIHRAGSNHER